jgi:RND family efflux transporter MFP subunit
MRPEHSAAPNTELERDIANESVTHASDHDVQAYHQNLRRLKWLAIILGCLVMVVGVVKFVHYMSIVSDASAQASAERQVEVIKLSPSVSAKKVILPAQVTANHEARLQARVNGYIADIKVDIGDHVQAGQLLAVISTPELDAELSAAQAQLQSAQSRQMLALSTEQRVHQTLAGAVSDQERDLRQTEVKSSSADVSAAKARLTQYEALTQFKRVTAPFSGVIKSRLVDIGTLVISGGAQATALFEVVQDNPLRIYASVPEYDSTHMDPVALIEMTQGAQPIKAPLTRQAGALDDNTRTRLVEWDIPNPEHRWLPGTQAKLTLTTVGIKAYSVPATAVLFNAQGAVIAVVGADNIAHWVSVKVIEDNGKTLLIDGNIGNAANVIKSPKIGLEDGMSVKIVGSGGAP